MRGSEQQSIGKREWVIITCLIAGHLFYMLSGKLDISRHLVEFPGDRAIPFTGIFVIPYILWYGYVAVVPLYILMKDQKNFFRLELYVIFCIAVCCITYVVYPTCIDFRPETLPGNDMFSCVTEAIYRADNPVNVMPSMHCCETTAVLITAFVSKAFCGKKKAKAFLFVTAVLICVSTVMIKQHSLWDLITGIGLAGVTGLIFFKAMRKKE